MPKEKKVVKKGTERFKTGSKGEKRPIGVTPNAVRVMEIATGIREDKYVDGRKPPPKEKVKTI